MHEFGHIHVLVHNVHAHAHAKVDSCCIHAHAHACPYSWLLTVLQATKTQCVSVRKKQGDMKKKGERSNWQRRGFCQL